MIQSGTQIINNVSNDLLKFDRQIPGKTHFVDQILRMLKVRLSDNFAEVRFVTKSLGFPFEVGEVTVSPSEFAPRTIEWMAHFKEVYTDCMKSNAKSDDQYAAFENLLRRVVQVPHSEIKAQLDAEKRAKKRKKKRPKTSDASHASRDKD
jgi:hypothetical protein